MSQFPNCTLRTKEANWDCRGKKIIIEKKKKTEIKENAVKCCEISGTIITIFWRKRPRNFLTYESKGYWEI